jgi:hypothetical protein
MESRNLPTPELEEEVRVMIGEGHTIAAIKRLRSATGWGLAEAKLWVDRASDDGGSVKCRTGTPCPYCGSPLRTDSAKQCFERGMDWHDANNIIRR